MLKNNFVDLAIIGGGPAGMMAAVAAAKQAKQAKTIAIFEGNSQLGKKLNITGKGRCNFTNDCVIEDLIAAFGKNGKFLYPAFYTFSNQDLIEFFKQAGLESKVERGGRVFPVSDQADDVIDVLKNELKKLKVKIYHNAQLLKLRTEKELFYLTFNHHQQVTASKLIIATGGKSYPITGSTGDGYKFAKQFGHDIVTPSPALSALYASDEFIVDLAGLTLKNVQLSFFAEQKKFFEVFGEMLFTHQGISGPVVLTASKYVYEHIKEKQEVKVVIDLKPALSEAQLRARLERELQDLYRKEYQSLLKELLPNSLIDLCLTQTNIDPHRKNSSLSEKEIQTIIFWLKNFTINISGVAPLELGIVTAGGVSLKQIDPATMQSKLVKNLYFAGEVLDLDAPTGGFNLQAAFSTGYLAGLSAVASN